MTRTAQFLWLFMLQFATLPQTHSFVGSLFPQPPIHSSSSRSRSSSNPVPLHSWKVLRSWEDIERTSDDVEEAADKRAYDNRLFVTALVPPVLAFFFYGEVSHVVAYTTNFFGFNGVNVDGNAFANNLLRPTINGVVVPATGVCLGTLFATTVNVLWNRQLMLRSCINKEVCELRQLRRAVFGSFGTAQHGKRRSMALGLIHSYTRTVIAETQINGLRSLEDTQMTGGISLNELDELAEMLHGVDGAASSRQDSVSRAVGLLVSLNDHRSERVATTMSTFPNIHWSLLDVLYSGIVVSFLLDSNQEVNQYLNSIQLRILFSVLILVGSGAAMLLKDLEDPFQGSFCINLAAKQLKVFDELLLGDISEAEAERERYPTGQLVSLDRSRPRPNYNAGNTIYFHLLTGPRGASIRVLGEILAWTVRHVRQGWTTLKRVILWPKRRWNQRTRSG